MATIFRMGSNMETDLYTITDVFRNIISDQATLKSALEKLDEAALKVLLVVAQDKFVATLTDGDVRRAILAGASLDTSITQIANYNPLYLRYDDEDMARQYLELVTALPLVDDEKKIQKLYIKKIEEQPVETEKITFPVVIMAGGLGTRLYPYTKILPKPLIPVRDIPIAERIIQSFQRLGCEQIHMIVNYKKNMIKVYFSDSNYNITFWDETETLGTGGGLYLLKETVKDTFILTNCDVLIMSNVKEIVKHHKQVKNKATMVCSIKNFVIPYGIVHFSEGGEIESFEEKPQMSFFTNTGYYILEKEAFQYIGQNERIGMPDIIERMKNAGEKVGIFPIGENSWLDMGQFDTMESMERKLSELNL